MQYIISWIDCFLLLQLLNMMSADPFREDCARMGTFKKKYHGIYKINVIILINVKLLYPVCQITSVFSVNNIRFIIEDNN